MSEGLFSNFLLYIDAQESSFCISAQLLIRHAGPSCSKLRMSLVNDSLKFTSSDTQIC